MNKHLEAELLKRALHELVKRDPAIMSLRKDLLTAMSERLGIARSTLGVWISPKGKAYLSTEGLRIIAQHLQAAGADQAARELVAKIVSSPLGMRLDSGRQRGLF